nr:MSMEG_6728 family protein [Microbacterium lemovicicum]
MQTFLPYPSFARSAAVLDAPRLGKQRVETFQLLRAQTIPDYGWRHHPAATMWAGRLPALVAYGVAVTDAWIAAGHADTVRPKLLAFAPEVDGVPQDEIEMPDWLGDPAFHRSHQSNLLRKDPEFYGPLFGDVPDDLPYVWPTTGPSA